MPGTVRRKRVIVVTSRAEHDRFVELLASLGRPVIAGFEATGNYHRTALFVGRTTPDKPCWRRLSAQIISGGLFMKIVGHLALAFAFALVPQAFPRANAAESPGKGF